MDKQNLTRASRELFRRAPDECFDSLAALSDFCRAKRAESVDTWHAPAQLVPDLVGEQFGVKVGSDGAYLMNDWSFSQLCKFAGSRQGNRQSALPQHGEPSFRRDLAARQ